jgi:hypothetical protein
MQKTIHFLIQIYLRATCKLKFHGSQGLKRSKYLYRALLPFVRVCSPLHLKLTYYHD